MISSKSKRIQRKVQVWIYCREAGGALRVLLLRLISARGGGWQPVTGGVEGDEALQGAAEREAREETEGAFLGGAEPIGYEFSFDGRWGPAQETVFALEAREAFEPKIDSREHVEWKWVSPQEAEAMLHFDSNREALRRLTRWIGRKVTD